MQLNARSAADLEDGIEAIRASMATAAGCSPTEITGLQILPERDAPNAGLEVHLTIDADVDEPSALNSFKTVVVSALAQELEKSLLEIEITSLRAAELDESRSTIVGVFIREKDLTRAAAASARLRSGSL